MNQSLSIHVGYDQRNNLPSIKIFPKGKWIKHVYCETSRFHVVSYHGLFGGGLKLSCSQKNCIFNAPKEVHEQAVEFLSEKKI